MTGSMVLRTRVMILYGAFLCEVLLPAEVRIPCLRQHGTAVQLMVDGRPFLILGGELANSSASSLTYLEPIWPRLRACFVSL